MSKLLAATLYKIGCAIVVSIMFITIQEFTQTSFLSLASSAIDMEASNQQPQQLTLNDWVTDISFSPDGRLLAASGADQVKIWDTSNWQLVWVLKHSDDVDRLAFAPSGKMLATIIDTRNESSLSLWDLDTGKKIGFDIERSRNQIDEQNKQLRITSLSFSPSGKLIALGFFGGLGANNGIVKLLNVEDPHQIKIVSNKFACFASKIDGTAVIDNAVSSLDFSPDDRLLAVSTRNGLISILEIATAKELHQTTILTNVLELKFSPNGEYLAFDGIKLDGRRNPKLALGILRSQNWQQLACLQDYPCGKGLDFLSGDLLVSAQEDGVISVLDLKINKAILTIDKLGAISASTVSQKNKIVAYGSKSGTVRTQTIKSSYDNQAK